MTTKIRRNELCPCGSGQKYKYCCISNELKRRTVKTDEKCADCGTHLEVDLSEDFMNVFASMEIPLKNFCKDNEFYLFGNAIVMGKIIEFNNKLRAGELTKSSIIQAYTNRLTREAAIGLVEDSVSLHKAFGARINILRDAINAHFDRKYTLSVPVLFAQIEGLIREIGGLELRDNFRPNVSTEIWNSRYLFGMSDSAQYFNAFITKLFEGKKDDQAFNRNPVLHGMNVTYDSEEWSLILVLTILEIRQFLWFERNTENVFSKGI
ncbi:MAG: SEC-C domain-containing protein [Pseudomonadota bacterium]